MMTSNPTNPTLSPSSQISSAFQLETMWANAKRDGALPNIGGALCSTPESLADAHY